MEHSQRRTEASSSYEQVDLIRFLKTNGKFYDRAILCWLKFTSLHQAPLELAFSTQKNLQYGLQIEFKRMLSYEMSICTDLWMSGANPAAQQKPQLSRDER